MKISKLLSKACLSIFIILISFSLSIVSAEEELVDIWKLEKKIDNEDLQGKEFNDNSNIENSAEGIKNYNSDEIINNIQLEENNINLAGIYDPAENGLSITMWSNSDGNEITKIFNRIKKLIYLMMLKKFWILPY